jgi:hypothetical protein
MPFVQPMVTAFAMAWEVIAFLVDSHLDAIAVGCFG